MLNKIKLSNCKFFAITNYANIKENIDIKGYGHHRFVNIEISPYNLNDVFYKIDDYDKLYTIRLMARGPRRWHTKYQPATEKYFRGAFGIPQNQKLLHGNADSNLNHKFAEEFDVYIHRSREMESTLRTEINTGLSAGDQSKIRKLRSEIWHLEWKAKNKVKHA